MFSSYLPLEIILKILSLLPGKTLPKLRLVSKQFNSLISQPYLLRLHHRFALNSFSILTAFTALRSSLTVELKLFLFTKPNHDQTQQTITKRFLGDRVRVFSSNHQLLCFVSDKEHFLFDPINQKTRELPKSSSLSSSPNVISFGFVSSTLQYKIIRFFLPYYPICKFEILTVNITRSNYKHHLEISPCKSQEQKCPYLLQPYPPVQADGFVYWTTTDIPKIVSFSLEQEKFSVLPPPPCFEDNPNHDFSLCGIRGKLFVINYNSLEPNMEIWMMNGSNGCDWVKTHRIGLKGTLIRYYPSFPIRIHDIQSDFVLLAVKPCILLKRLTLDDTNFTL
ncbi:unnamed protein product [Thlaspi arvense]|uniref:F-box domain-containing protein n=1 Tax=Thlaspi arvense TaxID=13288 RepID=A0AAU9S9G8_THLAR|nr:unnamed protein product [Thlaspi arvense]